MKSIKSFMVVLALTLAIGAVAKDDDSKALSFNPPEGSELLLKYPLYPASRLWRYRNRGNTDGYTTRNSVGTDSAALLYTDNGQDPIGGLMYVDLAVKADQTKIFKGISFWFKGDGGEGELVIGTGWGMDYTKAPVAAIIPLKDNQWRKVFITWDKFTPSVAATGFENLSFTFRLPAPRRAWAQIARISKYSIETTEKINPIDDADPAGIFPAADYITDRPDAIAKTLEKLRNKQPVTIATAGDSITAGAQLWGYGGNNHYNAYTAQLGRMLKKHYGYEKYRSILKTWSRKNGFVIHVPAANIASLEGMDPAIDPKDQVQAFDGLQLIAVGAGGQHTQFGFENLDQVTSHKPDLVIWLYGGNDLYKPTTERYTQFTRFAVKALQRAGIEVVIASVTCFTEDEFYPHSTILVKEGEKIARELKVPFVNNYAAFNARGRRYLGDLLGDNVHPNEYGHELIATLLAQTLGVPEQKIWVRPLFQALQQGEKIPK